jgi:hypothetical protein
MPLIVIDNKKNMAYYCSFTHAAKLIGITRLTLMNWRNKKDKETYNQFDIYFDFIKIKQKPRGSNQSLYN